MCSRSAAVLCLAALHYLEGWGLGERMCLNESVCVCVCVCMCVGGCDCVGEKKDGVRDRREGGRRFLKDFYLTCHFTLSEISRQ